MIVGLPKEIKDNEYRVGLTPAGVRALTDAGHRVLVETTAGAGSGFEDSLYQTAGAAIAAAADDVWADAEMIVKVKEPIAPEYPRMREGQLLFTYLHLAPDNELTEQLLERKVTGVAYETITDRRGTLPLLTPMRVRNFLPRTSISVRARRSHAASAARLACAGSLIGAPHAAITASPTYLMIVPFFSRMHRVVCSKYAIRIAETSAGSRSSESVVKFSRSVKMTVASTISPPGRRSKSELAILSAICGDK